MIGQESSHTLSGKEKVYKASGSRNLHMHIYSDAEVISTQDETDSMSVEVRVRRGGQNYTVRCQPLLPMHLYLLPQVGDNIKVLVVDTELDLNTKNNAYWVGPTVTNYPGLGHPSATRQKLAPGKAISTDPAAKGLYPEKKDVALLGRGNADIIVKNQELLLRAGQRQRRDPNQLNVENPAYVQLHFGEEQSTANIVADRINLISHQGDGDFPAWLDEAAIERFLGNTHPVAWGDNITRLFKVIIKFMRTHRHRGAATPTYDELDTEGLEERLHSNHVKVN